ncbi:MAG: toxic anion resistance protein [Deferribacteraceae bacterium]|jgi:uncharacterized protein YaaN involved in tellurite resistance|nr:toxic anion resistance protein [Deferribacteraceae bacterium]
MDETNEIVAYTKDNLPAEKRAEVVKMKEELDLGDSNSIISFGAAAQSKTSGFVESILASTKAKDAGEAGILLSDLMGNLEKFNADAANKGNFITRIFSDAKSRINRLAASYQSVEVNIDKIVDQLEKHRMQLMQNTAMLDKLYDKNVDYVNELNLYIMAGEEKLAELNDTMLPALKAKSELDQLSAQQYRDLIDTSDRLDKKIHDLKLTRTVSLQSLPQIRLQQSGNNVLVDKIHSSIVNAIPLWKSQLVIALGLAQTGEALKAQRAVSETTNRLLQQNSEMLKISTIETAKEAERGIVDIETITKANEDIISTIKQVASIQQESRAKRQEAEQELKRLESELKANIIQALEAK